jgi:hypothetical protein
VLTGDANLHVICRQRETIVRHTQTHHQGYLPLTALTGELPFKLLIVIPIECHPCMEVARHLMRIETVTLCPIDTKTLQLTFLINET